LEEKSKWDKYRPDILMIAGTTEKTHKAQRSGCTVVEIKYCRDTDPTMGNRAGQRTNMMQLPQQKATAV
jgi:hypothetical protein